MTSRERVQKVLRHEIPDRVPNGSGASETMGRVEGTFFTVRNVPRICLKII